MDRSLCGTLAANPTVQEESWQTRETLVRMRLAAVRSPRTENIVALNAKERATPSNLIATAVMMSALAISNR